MLQRAAAYLSVISWLSYDTLRDLQQCAAEMPSDAADLSDKQLRCRRDAGDRRDAGEMQEITSITIMFSFF